MHALKSSIALLVIGSWYPAAAWAHDPEGLRAIERIEATLAPPVVKRLRERERAPQVETLTRALTEGAERATKQVMSLKSKWPDGALLDVCFLDGSPESERAFLDVLKEEVDLTNLKLSPAPRACSNGDGQIRVSFSQPGYWSFVGTEALLIPPPDPTLNLQGMGLDGGWTDDMKGTARHEIGHLLGLFHEHQHPDVDCGFKSDEEIAVLLNWTLQQARTNFDKIKRDANIITGAYDPKSVMHYQLSPSFFVAGENARCYIESRNNVLSADDTQFLKDLYRPQ
jgi:hypothetical protein